MIYQLTRRVQKYLALEFQAWQAARGERDQARRARLEALSLRAHIQADVLQHRIIQLQRS
jgi:hypothetical protein